MTSAVFTINHMQRQSVTLYTQIQCLFLRYTLYIHIQIALTSKHFLSPALWDTYQKKYFQVSFYFFWVEGEGVSISWQSMSGEEGKINDIIALTTRFSYLNWQHQLKLFHGFLQWYIWERVRTGCKMLEERIHCNSLWTFQPGDRSLEAMTPSVKCTLRMFTSQRLVCAPFPRTIKGIAMPFTLADCQGPIAQYRDEEDNTRLYYQFHYSVELNVPRVTRWVIRLTTAVRRLRFWTCCSITPRGNNKINKGRCQLSVCHSDSGWLTVTLQEEDQSYFPPRVSEPDGVIVSLVFLFKTSRVRTPETSEDYCKLSSGDVSWRGAGMRALHSLVPNHSKNRGKYHMGLSDHLKIHQHTPQLMHKHQR